MECDCLGLFRLPLCDIHSPWRLASAAFASTSSASTARAASTLMASSTAVDGAVDAIRRASKGSRLTIVEIGHGEFARALLRSLTADEAAEGIEEIVVCSASCDVEALADGLPPVPMSAWKSPCRKVRLVVPRTG